VEPGKCVEDGDDECKDSNHMILAGVDVDVDPLDGGHVRSSDVRFFPPLVCWWVLVGAGAAGFSKFPSFPAQGKGVGFLFAASAPSAIGSAYLQHACTLQLFFPPLTSEDKRKDRSCSCLFCALAAASATVVSASRPPRPPPAGGPSNLHRGSRNNGQIKRPMLLCHHSRALV
jgi:hypothetical protein